MNLTSVQNRIAQVTGAPAGFGGCGVFLLALAGCGLLEAEQQDGRIVMGKSIDGVQIYDRSTDVARKLGEPSSVMIGDFAGFVYEYGDGKFAGLRVLFASPFDEKSIHVWVKAPYGGTTKEGIGVGTARATVREFLGRPATTSVSVDWKGLGAPTFRGDVYLYDSSAFVFAYDQNDRVELIQIILLGK